MNLLCPVAVKKMVAQASETMFDKSRAFGVGSSMCFWGSRSIVERYLANDCNISPTDLVTTSGGGSVRRDGSSISLRSDWSKIVTHLGNSGHVLVM
jgi:hypothetical protein